jgi:hypothetical protein
VAQKEMNTLFEYIYKYPWAGWTTFVLATIAFVWWLNKPVTWADHEGSVTKDTENVLLVYGGLTGKMQWILEWWARREK